MAQEYIVNPCVGFNNVQLNEKREDVRIKLGQFNEFKKNKFSKNTSDDFGDIHVYYDENDTVEAVEFFEGEVFIRSDKLFPIDKTSLFEILKEIDNNTVLTEDSISSKELCISAYAPGEKAESLLIYREDYFSIN